MTTTTLFTDRPTGLFTAIGSSLGDLLVGLKAEDQLKYDRIILPGTARMVGGRLVLPDDLLDPSDPTSPSLPGETYGEFTRLARNQLSTVLGIPWSYTERMFNEAAVDLYDHNVNEWLDRHGKPLLVRAIATNNGYVARAILSNKYAAIDVIAAALGGLQDSGITPEITGADRTEGRMFVRVAAPGIVRDIGHILGNYTYRGRSGKDYPLVGAGLVLGNSEVGGAAVSVRPEIRLQVCSNGMTMDVAAGAAKYRRIHYGAAISETGEVKWSDETRHNVLALIRSQIKDAATTFLSAEYLDSAIAEIEGFSRIQIAGTDAATKAVDLVTQRLKFSDTERDAIFAEFLKGQDESAFGIAQAVSAAAHGVRLTDPERAAVLEAAALPAAALVSR